MTIVYGCSPDTIPFKIALFFDFDIFLWYFYYVPTVSSRFLHVSFGKGIMNFDIFLSLLPPAFS